MEDQMIRLAVHTQTLALTAVERAQEARDRLAEERGQTAAEYLGIILLVAVIIAALAASGIAADIVNGIQKLIGNIGKGESPK